MEENFNTSESATLFPTAGEVMSESTFNLDEPIFVDEEAMADDPGVNDEGHPYFIEGNTNAYTLEDLRKHIVPVFATNELTLAHTDIARAVYSAAANVFGLENLSPLEFRGSHPQQGRIPSALKKPASELLESEKTCYLQRIACCFTVKNYARTICEQPTDLCIGFMRSYHTTNLYSAKSPEKISIWCSRRCRVCSNLCMSVNGLKENLEVMSVNDIYAHATELFKSYIANADEDVRMLEGLGRTRISISQFCQLVGRLRYYSSLDTTSQKELPKVLLGDSLCYEATRLFIDSRWGLKDGEDSLTLFCLLQCFTEACKGSYLHNWLSKEQNCVELIRNLQYVLEGDTENPYSWFLS